MCLKSLLFLPFLLVACSTQNVSTHVGVRYHAEPIKQNVNSILSAVKRGATKKHEFRLYSNRKVQKWIYYFTKKDRKRFSRFLNRGYYYQEMMKTILEEEEVPHVLYYLPLIESGFVKKAHSRAGAVGPWQFIKGTAKRYGLMVNKSVDERRDPVLSTEAAARYLTDLYNVFNSWELAIAAYNCGEMRVLRAIMKGNTRNFWTLSQKKLLPRETRNYVPKFLAAAKIGESFERYGFRIKKRRRFPDVDSYAVPGGVKLQKLARMIGHPYKKLKALNPSLRYGRTPSSLKNYSLWIPPKYHNKLKRVEPTLAKTRKARKGKLRESPLYYRVKSGDNLTRIARKFHISLNKIKRINRLKSSRIYKGQRLLVRSKQYKRVKGKQIYFAKRGDFLGRIARRHRVSVAYLRRLNGLMSNRLYVGQKLDVTKGVKHFQYRVKRGDNLTQIAKLYQVSIASLKKKNRIRRSNQIYVGQVLKI